MAEQDHKPSERGLIILDQRVRAAAYADVGQIITTAVYGKETDGKKIRTGIIYHLSDRANGRMVSDLIEPGYASVPGLELEADRRSMLERIQQPLVSTNLRLYIGAPTSPSTDICCIINSDQIWVAQASLGSPNGFSYNPERARTIKLPNTPDNDGGRDTLIEKALTVVVDMDAKKGNNPLLEVRENLRIAIEEIKASSA